MARVLLVYLTWLVLNLNESEAVMLTWPKSLMVQERSTNVSFNYTFSEKDELDFWRVNKNGSLQCYILQNGVILADACRRTGTNKSYQVSNSGDTQPVIYQVLVADVQPDDAGTYCMSDNDGDSTANRATTELVIIGAPPVWCRAVDSDNVILRFDYSGNVDVKVNCSHAPDTDQGQGIAINRQQDGVLYFSNPKRNVQRCTTTLEVTQHCGESCSWKYTSDVLSGGDGQVCSINNQNTDSTAQITIKPTGDSSRATAGTTVAAVNIFVSLAVAFYLLLLYGFNTEMNSELWLSLVAITKQYSFERTDRNSRATMPMCDDGMLS